MTGTRGTGSFGGTDDRGLSTLRAIALAAVVVVGSVGGAFALGVVGAPAVEGVENRFGEVTNETTTIESELTVNNPNPIGARLAGVTAEYGVTMNGIAMANGTKEGVDLGTGNTSIPFSTALDNSKIPAWWVSHVENDEHTELRVNADVHSSLVDRSYSTQVTREIDTSIVEAFRTSEPTPLNADAPVVSDPVLYLNRTEAEWGEVNDETTGVEMTLYLHNPKSYPITLSEVGYDIYMNNVTMGGGEAGRTTTIPPGETVPVEATTEIRTQRLDEWWVSHLQRDQVTNLTMPFYLVVDLGEAGGGEQRIELDSYQRTVETDVFGTKSAGDDADGGSGDDGSEDGSADAGDEDSDNGDAADGTATATPEDDGSGDGTATPTESPTATPTESPTSTPDDGTSTDDGLFALEPGADSSTDPPAAR
ncbi:LEA type 2 family protein [Halobaculum sp. CBA1158]|uniref:LEA type 2 family protein n=1 Tax=Halobaculum sp. CBA1158 TaxID=2904243 RepID=UPI001F3ADEA2|nr:LEA type 2 family protein [Halobaculum sp. CBA1158]UIO99272.1 LEA type 2 family protein [Halobaculum sp. CBA1158]